MSANGISLSLAGTGEGVFSLSCCLGEQCNSVCQAARILKA